MGRTDDGATAFTGCGFARDINFAASWLPHDSSPSVTGPGARSAWKSIQPLSHGAYANFLVDEPLDHVKIADGDHTYEWLSR